MTELKKKREYDRDKHLQRRKGQIISKEETKDKIMNERKRKRERERERERESQKEKHGIFIGRKVCSNLRLSLTKKKKKKEKKKKMSCHSNRK